MSRPDRHRGTGFAPGAASRVRRAPHGPDPVLEHWRSAEPLPDSGSPFASDRAGVYHLAISGRDNDPVDNAGPLFGNVRDRVVGPQGAGGADPVLRWNSKGRSGTGTYRIHLTGVSYCPP